MFLSKCWRWKRSLELTQWSCVPPDSKLLIMREAAGRRIVANKRLQTLPSSSPPQNSHLHGFFDRK